jgi:GNAT superfamily N-acetyltransferase
LIREATAADIPRLVEMGERFFEASGYADIATFDTGAAEQTTRDLLAGGVVLVAEAEGEVVGMAGALVYRFYFSKDDMTAQELVWWVEPEHRGIGQQLHKALEDGARERGATSISMIALDSMKWVGRLYERAGYRPSEHCYIKRL